MRGPRIGETPDERDLTRRAYERRVAAQVALDGGRALQRVRAQEARLRELGIAADLVGMPEETVKELVDEWVRLIGAYPKAARRWKSAEPDVDGTRVGSWRVMCFGAGRMFWDPLQMALPRGMLESGLLDAVAEGMQPDGCGSIRALACHEFGHAVEDAVCGRLRDSEWSLLVEELAECDVCGCTRLRPDEALAVAFAALHHGQELGDGARRAVCAIAHAPETLGM